MLPFETALDAPRGCDAKKVRERQTLYDFTCVQNFKNKINEHTAEIDP